MLLRAVLPFFVDIVCPVRTGSANTTFYFLGSQTTEIFFFYCLSLKTKSCCILFFYKPQKMTSIPPEAISDRLADQLTSNRNKNTLHYFCSPPTQRELEVEIHHFKDSRKIGPRYIVILESHKHHRFFLALKRHVLCKHKCTDGTSILFFPGLTMKSLNATVAALHRGDPRLCGLAAEIGPGYPLPQRFDAILLNYDESCVSILDPRFIRCVTNTFGFCEHISCRLRVFLDPVEPMAPGHDLPASVRPSQARTYEMKRSCMPTWPVLAVNPDQPERVPEDPFFPVFVLEFEPAEEYARCWYRYLVELITGKSEKQNESLQKVIEQYPLRYERQAQSRHVPAVHGRTLYGHCLPNAIQISGDVAPIIFANFPARKIVFSTGDLAIHA